MSKIKFGCLFIILVCLTLLCGCFSHTGSFSDDDSVDIIYEQSFAVEDSDTLTDELIDALVEYLQGLGVEYELPDTSLSIKINNIKKGSGRCSLILIRRIFISCADTTTE